MEHLFLTAFPLCFTAFVGHYGVGTRREPRTGDLSAENCFNSLQVVRRLDSTQQHRRRGNTTRGSGLFVSGCFLGRGRKTTHNKHTAALWRRLHLSCRPPLTRVSAEINNGKAPRSKDELQPSSESHLCLHLRQDKKEHLKEEGAAVVTCSQQRRTSIMEGRRGKCR